MAAIRRVPEKDRKTMKRNLFAALTLSTLFTAGVLSAQTPTATESSAAATKKTVVATSSSTQTTTKKPVTKTVVKSKKKHVTKKTAPKKTTTYTIAPPTVQVKVKPQ
jgi:hypothetical protein